MRIALAQINPLVGDLKGNAEIILHAYSQSSKEGANLLLTPELSLWGYPPKDLLLNDDLFKEQQKALEYISRVIQIEDQALKILIGIAEPIQDNQLPNLFNSIALVDSSGWEVIARKQLLPTYDVFDEKRYFRPAEGSGKLHLEINQTSWHLGITICEDLWVEDEMQFQRILGPDPIAKLESQKIDLLLNLSASPFSQNKLIIRQRLAGKAAKRLNCPVIYLNQIGANDELIFDGGSFIVDKESEVTLSLPTCREEIIICEPIKTKAAEIITSYNQQEELFLALVLGVRDYAKKCGFKSAIIGLSGGIDSALVTVIAAAALGPKNVTGLLMPSPWSSIGSIKDALALAKELEILTHTLPIEPLIKSYHSTLESLLGESPEGITAENLQSRIRGTLLMALANQKGHLLLSTGNKSELAVGYCTLYGDMNGGLAVIGDLYKTSVFKLCKWIDSRESLKLRSELGFSLGKELIGEAILNKPPSAELRPGQLDSDSLPDYEVLDTILKALIEKESTTEQLIHSGYSSELIEKIQKLFKQAEFKRKQAPPLLKVSNQAFGSGWRLPIAAK